MSNLHRKGNKCILREHGKGSKLKETQAQGANKQRQAETNKQTNLEEYPLTQVAHT